MDYLEYDSRKSGNHKKFNIQNRIPFTTKNSNLTTQPGSPLSFQKWKHFFPRSRKKSSE